MFKKISLEIMGVAGPGAAIENATRPTRLSAGRRSKPSRAVQPCRQAGHVAGLEYRFRAYRNK